MKRINNLYSLEGRKLLYNIFNELRFEKQFSSLKTLIICWQIATKEREINRYSSYEAIIENPLGFFKGTKIWLEEIVNRFYFSTVNSFVYFGAAILLVLVGLRRFSNIDDSIVIAGVIFEALMLIFMFIIMLFTPTENNIEIKTNNILEKYETDKNFSVDLLEELGEISRDFADISLKLNRVADYLYNFTEKQEYIINSTKEIITKYSELSSPNPKILDLLNETNIRLDKFNEEIKKLTEIAGNLKEELIEQTVRKELEILLDKLAKSKLNNEDK